MEFTRGIVVEKLKTYPELSNIILFVYALLSLVAVGFAISNAAPVIYKWYIKKRKHDKDVNNSIWFDSHDSNLHRGRSKIRIEPNSFEYFVCVVSFKSPDKYHSDLDIFDEADRVKGLKETKRGVEQAVRRLNKKTKILGLKVDLFVRSKEQTAVSVEYRKHIRN